MVFLYIILPTTVKCNSDRPGSPTSPAAAPSCPSLCWSSTPCLTAARREGREGLGRGGKNQQEGQLGRLAPGGPLCQWWPWQSRRQRRGRRSFSPGVTWPRRCGRATRDVCLTSLVEQDSRPLPGHLPAQDQDHGHVQGQLPHPLQPAHCKSPQRLLQIVQICTLITQFPAKGVRESDFEPGSYGRKD